MTCGTAHRTVGSRSVASWLRTHVDWGGLAGMRAAVLVPPPDHRWAAPNEPLWRVPPRKSLLSNGLDVSGSLDYIPRLSAHAADGT